MTSEMLQGIGVLIVRQIKRRINSNSVSPKTRKAGTTLVKRGHLRNSIKYRVDGNSVIISAGGPGVPYAKIHHIGGIIRPKNAQYLAIPLNPEAALYRPRAYPGKTFIAKGVIFKQVDGGAPIAMWALKKQVEIPARRYMYLDTKDEGLIRSAVVAWMKKELGVVR